MLHCLTRNSFQWWEASQQPYSSCHVLTARLPTHAHPPHITRQQGASSCQTITLTILQPMMKSRDASCLHWRQWEKRLTQFFWADSPPQQVILGMVLQSLVFDLSSGLLVWDKDAECKAEIHHQLLTLLLSWAAHYACIVETPSTFEDEGECEFWSEFKFEPSKEKKSGMRGRKPTVYYALSGHITGNALYHVAAEAKAKLVQSDVSQPAQCMSTLVNG